MKNRSIKRIRWNPEKFITYFAHRVTYSVNTGKYSYFRIFFRSSNFLRHLNDQANQFKALLRSHVLKEVAKLIVWSAEVVDQRWSQSRFSWFQFSFISDCDRHFWSKRQIRVLWEVFRFVIIVFVF